MRSGYGTTCLGIGTGRGKGGKGGGEGKSGGREGEGEEAKVVGGYLKLLASDLVGHGPVAVIFLEDLGIFDNLLELFDDTFVHKNLLANHGIVLVV